MIGPSFTNDFTDKNQQIISAIMQNGFVITLTDKIIFHAEYFPYYDLLLSHNGFYDAKIIKLQYNFLTNFNTSLQVSRSDIYQLKKYAEVLQINLNHFF